MKKKNKFNFIGMANLLAILLIPLLFLSSCGLIKDASKDSQVKDNYKNNYNAKFISLDNKIKTSFEQENLIGSVLLDSGEYSDVSLPRQRHFVVNNQAEFQEIFEGESPIDFDNNTLIVYTVAYVNAGQYKLLHCVLEENKLVIKYKYEVVSNNGYCNTHAPRQGWEYIQLNKVEFEEVEISKII